MDRDTRSAIERATQRARKLLEEDFAAQLEGDFDVHKDGEMAAKAGNHLSARQALQRERIVAAIEHKRAAGMTPADAARDYLRDAAFTTLNRFVALKMLEARELVQECITKGEQSAGYREFCGMAPGLPLLPESAGYRLYIESHFDELSTEVKVLFDRRDPSSVLWPKRATFEQLLDILNAAELARVWREDETIGWVYQFFNGNEERKAMRDVKQGGSHAPRNSRELAVRNQFFTPRYVVQFLTDNTLGRIWYEMRGTKTALAERCEYMVRKPGEEFAPRAKKDPRDLRVLDPACGSGHFLLYAFDLLLAIYEEAYADLESPKSEATGKTLAEDYPSLDALRKAVPGLVLAHNLHGVDIDPRCAQIAQLALWMRAQKVYRDYGIGRTERAPIRRSNIVVAEPLVADDQMAKEFVAKLGEDELGRVFERLVASLNLAGDLGLLLRVEQLVKMPAKKQGDLFAPPEERIRAALDRFIREETSATSMRRRLFADDAAHGVALLGVAERKFDVVLMNPPFGDPTEATRALVRRDYPSAASDLALAVLQRAFELSGPEALTGILMPRPCYFLNSYEPWRRALGKEFHRDVHTMADLGAGVLDAVVEVVAAVFGPQDASQSTFLRILSTANKDSHLRQTLATHDHRDRFRHTFSRFAALPGAITAYSATEQIIDILESGVPLEQRGARAYQGLSTSDNERFVRIWVEVPRQALGSRWRPLAKGGAYSRYYSSIDLVVDWCADGRLLDAAPGTVLRNRATYFGSAGLTYTLKTKGRFSPRSMRAGCAYSPNGNAVFCAEGDADLMSTLGVMASRMFEALLMLSTATGDTASAGGPGRSYTNGIVNRIPAPVLRLPSAATDAVKRCVELGRSLNRLDEVSVDFEAEAVTALFIEGADFGRALNASWQRSLDHERELCVLDGEVDRAVRDAYGLGIAEASWLDECLGPHPTEIDSKDDERVAAGVEALRRPGGFLVEASRAFGIRRPDFVSELNLDDEPSFAEVCQYLRVSPDDLRTALKDAPPPDSFSRVVSRRLLSVAMGAVFGRWPISGRSSCIDIAVEDEGHASDVVSLIEQLADSSGVLRIAAANLGCANIREWVRRGSFANHLEDYTRSRRAAPIYWQLATPSASYSVWLYIHAFSKDTIFRVQNDYVAPKLAHEERRLQSLASELRDGASADQRRALAAQESLVEQLRAFLEQVKRVAPLWNPNLDDGVIINFAPLWRLVPQNRSWQKELKSTWDALCGGKYDWAHLAMHIWPERVVPQCAKDRSLAIAHGLEEVFWVEGSDGKWTARRTPTKSVDELVRERTSTAVKAALKGLLEAPVPGGKSAALKGSGRRKAAAAAEGGEP